MILHPLRFVPFYRPMVWGGRNLARLLGRTLPTGAAYGESWEVSDHPAHISQLADSTGTTLRQLMTEHPREMLGAAADRHAVFPWLIKFLDAQDWLSVQVHPDDVAVKSLWPGEGPKTEAWYILEAAPASRIYAGLEPGIGSRELRDALVHGAIADCLHSFVPKAGDCVFIPAGTVHAMGGGLLLAEIQQTSDATFRLFDWNRVGADGKPRALHVEQALASIHWEQGPVEAIGANAEEVQPLVACKYFELARASWSRPTSLGGTGRLQAVITIAGRGTWERGDACAPGDVWILPAAMPSRTLTPESPLSALVCTLPQ